MSAVEPVNRSSIKEKAPTSDSATQRTDRVCYLRCHFPELKSQLALIRCPELPRSPGIHRHNDEVEKTKEKASNSDSATQRTDQISYLRCHFPELKSQLALVRYPELSRSPGIHRDNDEVEETQGQAPLGSYPAAVQIAPPSDPAQAKGVLALQQHGGVGPRSRSMQFLGFCKPALSRVETQQGQTPLSSDPAAAQIAPPSDPAPSLRTFPIRTKFKDHSVWIGAFKGLGKAPNSDSESQRTDKFTYLRCHFPELKWQLALLRCHFPEQGGTTSPELSRSSDIHRHNAEVEETIPKLLGGVGPGSRFLQNIGYFKPTDSRDGKTAEDERPSSSDTTPIGPVGGPRTEENLSFNEAGVHKTSFDWLLDVVGELQSIVKEMNNRLIRVEEVSGIREVNPRGMQEEKLSVMQPPLDRSVSFSDWLGENPVTGLNETTQERVLQRSFAFHRNDVRLNQEQEAPEGSVSAPPRNDSSQQQPGPSGLLEAK